jgi:cobalt-zinc-cadmium efflux system outer membrane protein
MVPMEKSLIITISLILLLPVVSFSQDKAPAVPSPPGGYSMQEIIDIVIKNNPELATSKLELDAAQAQLKQEGLWDNPTFTAESENFSGDSPGFRNTENTFWLSQPFLLGGKRDFRKGIAYQELEIARLSYDAKKRNVILAVEKAVYDILLAQEMMELAVQAEEIARDVYKNKELQMAEKYSAEVLLSMEIELSEAEMDVLNGKKDLKIAKKQLALLLGESEVFSGECEETLERDYKIPEYLKLKECLLSNNPEIRVHTIREEQGNYLLKYAKSERIPDVELSVGVRQFNEDDTYSFVGGISVPLPLFNRNQGGIQEALVNQQKLEVEKNAEINSLLLELDEHYRTFTILEKEITVLKERILPKAEEMLNKFMEGYENKEVPYIGVLEARRKHIETRKKYVETLRDFNTTIAQLERLCSTRLHGTDGESY